VKFGSPAIQVNIGSAVRGIKNFNILKTHSLHKSIMQLFNRFFGGKTSSQRRVWVAESIAVIEFGLGKHPPQNSGSALYGLSKAFNFNYINARQHSITPSSEQR